MNNIPNNGQAKKYGIIYGVLSIVSGLTSMFLLPSGLGKEFISSTLALLCGMSAMASMVFYLTLKGKITFNSDK